MFTTFEGGAIICPDAKTKQRIDYLKNFGIADETTVIAPGINGKMNEIQAAMGMLQLRHVDEAIARRTKVDRFYRQELEGVDGLSIPVKPATERHNFSYFPILVEAGYPLSRDALYEKLKSSGIFARRYFYPLITEFPMYRSILSARSDNLPFATDIAYKILCLPIYPDLQLDQVERIIKLIVER